MSDRCFKCGTELLLSSTAQVGRGDSCHRCGADLRCCRNCRHHDSAAYNGCREPQAERVLEKERSNFCDYFHFGANGAANTSSARTDALKKLDDLFK